MQIRDAEIVRLIEQLGQHYRSNISNRFIRPALVQLSLDKQMWDLIEILCEKGEHYQYEEGYMLDELYQQIIAAARFVFVARRDLSPSLRSRLNDGSIGPDKVLKDMAVNNFSSNLRLFADLLNEIYIKLTVLDKAAARGRRPLYARIPELQEIGKLLASPE